MDTQSEAAWARLRALVPDHAVMELVLQIEANAAERSTRRSSLTLVQARGEVVAVEIDAGPERFPAKGGK